MVPAWHNSLHIVTHWLLTEWNTDINGLAVLQSRLSMSELLHCLNKGCSSSCLTFTSFLCAFPLFTTFTPPDADMSNNAFKKRTAVKTFLFINTSRSCTFMSWSLYFITLHLISWLSLLSVQVQRELVEELWWESWTPAVNSADPIWHVEQQTCLTHSEAGLTQLWTLFTNPTELCVREAQELFLNCCSLNVIKLLHLHVVLYLYLCIWPIFFLSVYISRVSYLWIKYSLFSYRRDFCIDFISYSCYNQMLYF